MSAPFEARIVPRRVVPSLATALLLAALGVVAALAADVVMGWVLAAIMLWSASGLARRMLRRGPAISIDGEGVRDHRVPVTMRWDEVERMRTVDRRIVFTKVALLELVPRGRFVRERGALVRAVLRGDVAFTDARNDERLMVDVQHLDRTPEEILEAARRHRAG